MKKKIVSITFLGFLVMLGLPQHATAAQIYLSPSSGRLNVGEEFTVQVLADSQGATINTAESNIVFSSATLELLEVSQGSTFLLPTPASKLVAGNTVYIGGGLPNPGFNGKSGVIGVLKFRAKSIGKANITLSRGRILLNDGTGSTTNVALINATFDITAAPVGEVKVFSKTHADQRGWSDQNDVEVGWTLPPNATSVSFVWDQNPSTIPDDLIESAETPAVNFKDAADGQWYFHIKAKGGQANDPFGQTTHYKVQIDTQAPLQFNVNVESESDLENTSTTPTISFNAEDKTSGVHRYDVFLDNRLVKELAVSPFVYEKQSFGPHLIKVVAYDRAGNSSVSELPITITLPAGEQPVTFNYLRRNLLIPIYGLILINLLIILAVAYLFHQRKKNQQVVLAVNEQMHNVRLAIERITGFESGMLQLRRDFDMKLRKMSEIRVAAPVAAVRSDIDKSVDRLSQQINIWFTEFGQIHSKDELANLQKKLEQQIQTEIDKNMKLLNDVVNNKLAEFKSKAEQDEAYNEISSRLNILQKLQGQITDSKYTNWRGHTNND